MAVDFLEILRPLADVADETIEEKAKKEITGSVTFGPSSLGAAITSHRDPLDELEYLGGTISFVQNVDKNLRRIGMTREELLDLLVLIADKEAPF